MVVMRSRAALAVLWLALQLLIFGPGDSSVVGTTTATAVKRIDVHAHFVPPFYRDVLSEKNLTSGGTPIPPWNATIHVEGQAQYNVETSILSVSAPGVGFFEPHQTSEMRKLARLINEYGRNMSVEYPGRLRFFATIPLPDVEGAIDETVYSLDVLKAAGVILFGNSRGVYLGNPKLDPLMEVLHERSAVVLVHPNTLHEEMERPDATGIPDVVAALDFLLDTSRAATNLVLKNVTGRYSNIKFLLAHSGGFIPYAAGRLSLIYSELLPNVYATPEDFLRLLQTFYVDLGFTGESQLHAVLDFVPPNQILYGSDWPSQSAGLRYVSSIVDQYPLSSQQRYDINFGNAAALFHQ